MQPLPLLTCREIEEQCREAEARNKELTEEVEKCYDTLERLNSEYAAARDEVCWVLIGGRGTVAC